MDVVCLTAGQQYSPEGWRMGSRCFMETKLGGLSRRYQVALEKYLAQGKCTSPRSADRLGREAVDMELETLDLARIHEQALEVLMSSGRVAGFKDRMIKRAQTFFVESHQRSIQQAFLYSLYVRLYFLMQSSQ